MWKVVCVVFFVDFFFFLMKSVLNVEELLHKDKSLKKFLFSGPCKTTVKDWEEI